MVVFARLLPQVLISSNATNINIRRIDECFCVVLEPHICVATYHITSRVADGLCEVNTNIENNLHVFTCVREKTRQQWNYTMTPRVYPPVLCFMLGSRCSKSSKDGNLNCWVTLPCGFGPTWWFASHPQRKQVPLSLRAELCPVGGCGWLGPQKKLIITKVRRLTLMRTVL